LASEARRTCSLDPLDTLHEATSIKAGKSATSASVNRYRGRRVDSYGRHSDAGSCQQRDEIVFRSIADLLSEARQYKHFADVVGGLNCLTARPVIDGVHVETAWTLLALPLNYACRLRRLRRQRPAASPCRPRPASPRPHGRAPPSNGARRLPEIPR